MRRWLARIGVPPWVLFVPPDLRQFAGRYANPELWPYLYGMQHDEKDAKSVLQAHHKEALSCATKLSKAADKALATTVDAAIPPEIIETLEPRLVHIAIRQHLLVNGRFDVAQRFGESCGLTPASCAADGAG